MLKTEADIEKALPMLAVPCILERVRALRFRSQHRVVSDGSRWSPSDRPQHPPRRHPLTPVSQPAEGDPPVRGRMKRASERFMPTAVTGASLAIEYFMKGEFYFNEMAPRPHNSGHYTIEGFD